MTKRICAVLLVFSLMFSLCACGCKHEWTPATCTLPATCSKCGETSGEPLGHSWTPATCTKPSTCSQCGETSGEPIDHEWIPATCTEPAKCAQCGKTDGEPLEHKAGEWEITKKATFLEQGERVNRCSLCGEIIKTEPLSLDKTYKNKKFIFSTDELCDALNNHWVLYGYNFIAIGSAIHIYKDRQQLGFILTCKYNDGDIEQKTEGFDSVMLALDTNGVSEIMSIAPGLLMTIDPALNSDDSSKFVKSLMLSWMSGGGEASSSKNGITYVATNTNDSIIIVALLV